MLRGLGINFTIFIKNIVSDKFIEITIVCVNNIDMPIKCKTECGRNAVLKRPKTSDALCKECFFAAFEAEIHYTIITNKLFTKGEKVAVAASGGKDSTVLAYA
ncbi:cytoplasmic tRNA 2-thiolation protein 1 isoform X3 [Bactrocera tryoni]|uniref:cytoplasmic tRNA 2-thiolation protein 1 isoform X3 n=1 Tax=Bactrocera tryoni TaxID=59916 RepID=UPI001A96754B|nr:cytoplasmic tRNA 2-thiolation protein 1 isoform X3 [Bactrocera tryoni]